MDYYNRLNTKEQNQVLSGLMQVVLKERIKNISASGHNKTMKYYLILQKLKN